MSRGPPRWAGKDGARLSPQPQRGSGARWPLAASPRPQQLSAPGSRFLALATFFPALTARKGAELAAPRLRGPARWPRREPQSSWQGRTSSNPNPSLIFSSCFHLALFPPSAHANPKGNSSFWGIKVVRMYPLHLLPSGYFMPGGEALIKATCFNYGLCINEDRGLLYHNH